MTPGDNDWDAAPDAPAAEPAAAPVPSGHVKVRCISDRRPWTDTKALVDGEEATVPEAVAAALLTNRFVERA